MDQQPLRPQLSTRTIVIVGCVSLVVLGVLAVLGVIPVESMLVPAAVFVIVSTGLEVVLARRFGR